MALAVKLLLSGLILTGRFFQLLGGLTLAGESSGGAQGPSVSGLVLTPKHL